MRQLTNAEQITIAAGMSEPVAFLSIVTVGLWGAGAASLYFEDSVHHSLGTQPLTAASEKNNAYHSAFITGSAVFAMFAATMSFCLWQHLKK